MYIAVGTFQVSSENSGCVVDFYKYAVSPVTKAYDKMPVVECVLRKRALIKVSQAESLAVAEVHHAVEDDAVRCFLGHGVGIVLFCAVNGVQIHLYRVIVGCENGIMPPCPQQCGDGIPGIRGVVAFLKSLGKERQILLTADIVGHSHP